MRHIDGGHEPVRLDVPGSGGYPNPREALALHDLGGGHDPVMRYAWAIGPADAPIFSGLDMAVVADDGRLVEVNGFFDD